MFPNMAKVIQESSFVSKLYSERLKELRNVFTGRLTWI
jgi:hypothetical protein